MPWRRTRDPYRIWLAEVMLQQTRVETVIPYYRRFLRRFPTLRSLARAEVDEALGLWAGLGYYARARSFHAAARGVMARHGGRVPRRIEEMRALPGVGRYTAGAVLSIAYGVPAPVVDGNVARVLCRVFGMGGDPKAGRTKARLWEMAERMVPDGIMGRRGDSWALEEENVEHRTPNTEHRRKTGQEGTGGELGAHSTTRTRTTTRTSADVWRSRGRGRSTGGQLGNAAGDFNQAMMELGATVCVPRGPACGVCPVSGLCEARRLGAQARLPRAVKRRPVPHYDVAVGLIWRRGKLLITKRPLEAMLGGLWEFPGGKREPGETLEDAVRREVKEEVGLEVEVGGRAAVVRHAYSHFRVTLHAYHCWARRGRVRACGRAGWGWVEPGRLGEYAFPAASVRVIEKMGEARVPRGGRAGRV